MAIPRMPKWMQKWRELEKLVWKKYACYVSIIGLRLHQFNEHKGARVELVVRRYAFHIGHGKSRITAITMAIRAIQANNELRMAVTVDEGRLLFINQPEDAEKMKDEIRIINECAT